jgi:hypothetical protein
VFLLAHYNVREDLAINDRILMRKGTPKKEGIVKAFDEEQAYILFDDGTEDWIWLSEFYITSKPPQGSWKICSTK